MPEQPPQKHKPTPTFLGVRGSDDAEQRARDLAAGVQAERDDTDPLTITTDALADIAQIAAHAWGTDKERDAALARINVIALGAWRRARHR